MDFQFSFEGLLSIVLGIAGIVVTYRIFYSQINKQLRLLLNFKNGYFSKEQATEFSIIYIDRIQTELHRKIDQFILDLKKDNADINSLLQSALYYEDEVKKSLFHIRGQTTDFYLINGKNFKLFIEETHEKFAEHIALSYQKLEAMTVLFAENEISLAELRMKTHKEIETAGRLVKDILKNEIVKVYKKE